MGWDNINRHGDVPPPRRRVSFWTPKKKPKKPPRGVFGGKRAFWRGGAQVRLGGSQAGEDTRPYEMRGPSGLAVGADDLGGPRAHTVRPYGGKRTGSVGSAKSGAEAGPHQKHILRTQGPSGSGRNRTQALLILRAGNFLPIIKGVTPVMGVRGRLLLSGRDGPQGGTLPPLLD